VQNNQPARIFRAKYSVSKDIQSKIISLQGYLEQNIQSVRISRATYSVSKDIPVPPQHLHQFPLVLGVVLLQLCAGVADLHIYVQYKNEFSKK
jgi:hypothetical protein